MEGTALRNLATAFCVVAVGLCGRSLADSTAAPKVAFVDYQRLMQQSPQGQEARAKLIAEFQSRQQELQGEIQAAKRAAAQLQSSGLPAGQRLEAEQKLRDSNQKLKEKIDQYQHDLYSVRSKLLAPNVQRYASAHGLDLVLADSVIFGNRKLDITEAVFNAGPTASDRSYSDEAIGFVDYAQLLQQSPEGKEVQAKLRAESQNKQRDQDASARLANELLSKLQLDVVKATQRYAQAQQFDIVVAGNVIWANPRIDLTQAVLANRAVPDIGDYRHLVIVYVDFARLMQESPQGKEAQAKLRAESLKKPENQEDLNDPQNQLPSKLPQEVLEEVQRYAGAQGYDLVLTGSVVVANPHLDITQAVLANLQTSSAPTVQSPAAPALPSTNRGQN